MALPIDLLTRDTLTEVGRFLATPMPSRKLSRLSETATVLYDTVQRIPGFRFGVNAAPAFLSGTDGRFAPRTTLLTTRRWLVYEQLHLLAGFLPKSSPLVPRVGELFSVRQAKDAFFSPPQGTGYTSLDGLSVSFECPRMILASLEALVYCGSGEHLSLEDRGTLAYYHRIYRPAGTENPQRYIVPLRASQGYFDAPRQAFRTMPRFHTQERAHYAFAMAATHRVRMLQALDGHLPDPPHRVYLMDTAPSIDGVVSPGHPTGDLGPTQRNLTP